MPSVTQRPRLCPDRVRRATLPAHPLACEPSPVSFAGARSASASPSAWCYTVAWAATLGYALLHLRPLGDAAGMAMLLFLLLEFRNQRRYAQVLFCALVGIGMLGVIRATDPAALFLAGWRRGAAYGAFFFALTTLRDAAETSPLVRRCGRHLVAQPPGRRYAALTAGGHVFGIILSYGAIELLAAMVMRANTLEAAGGLPRVQALRTRRMLMAIYRGFCVMNCWNPINLMTAVVSTAVPAAPMRLLLPVAFLASLGMAALGWLEDRISAARAATRSAARPETSERWSIHLRIVALVAGVMVLAEVGSTVLRISLVTCVTLVVPLTGAAWVAVQSRALVARSRSGLGAILQRRAVRFLHRVPSFRSEATVLAGSGFMGVAVGGVLAGGGIAPLLVLLPPIAVPLLVPVLLIATGQLGLNPVAVVALLGAALPNPAAFGVPPAVLAFACMLGWGLGVGMTPMSASAITTARWARVSPWTVSTAWNAAYTLSTLVLAWIAIAVLFVAVG